jgi:hypothetical protein
MHPVCAAAPAACTSCNLCLLVRQLQAPCSCCVAVCIHCLRCCATQPCMCAVAPAACCTGSPEAATLAGCILCLCPRCCASCMHVPALVLPAAACILCLCLHHCATCAHAPCTHACADSPTAAAPGLAAPAVHTRSVSASLGACLQTPAHESEMAAVPTQVTLQHGLGCWRWWHCI